MFNRKQAVVPPVRLRTETSVRTVYKFRKRRFERLIGLRDIHDADVRGEVIEIKAHSSHSRRGTTETSSNDIYAIGVRDFKDRLGISDNRDVRMVMVYCVAHSVEVTMA